MYVGEKMINEELVEEGYAVAKYYQPNGRYRDMLEHAQVVAEENGVGLWSVCK